VVPRILHLHPKTYEHLICLRKQAERDGAYRVAERLQALARYQAFGEASFVGFIH